MKHKTQQEKGQQEEIDKLEALQSWYIEQLKLRQKEKFAKSSEQLDEVDANQLSFFDLFNEAEELKIYPSFTTLSTRTRMETSWSRNF